MTAPGRDDAKIHDGPGGARDRRRRRVRRLAILAAALTVAAAVPPASAQQPAARVAPQSATGRILGVFPAYRSTPAARIVRPPTAAAVGAMAAQGSAATPGEASPEDNLDTLRLLQLQAIGCFALGIATSVAAVATLTAASAVQGGAPLPFLGEIVAGFVTFFTGGCAVGALLIPGITLFDGLGSWFGAAEAAPAVAEAPAAPPEPTPR